MKLLNISLPFLGIFLVSLFEGSAFKPQMVLTSDSLYMNSLSKDLLQGGSIFDWNLTQAPDYFPHMFVYLVISLFTEQAPTQLFLITLFQVALLGILFYLVFRKLGHSRQFSFLESTMLLTLVNFFQLHSQDWIYFYKTNNHFSSVLMGFTAFLITLVAAKNNSFGNPRIQILVFFVVLLGTLSTITFVYAITIPLFIMVIPMLFTRIHFFSRKIWFLLAVVLATVIALFVTTKSSSGSTLSSRLVFSDSEFAQVQDFFMKAFSRNMVHSGMIVRLITITAIATMLVLLFAFFFCSLRGFPNLENEQAFKLLLSFSAVSLISTTLLTFLSGGMVDEFFLRYFWPSIFFCSVSALFAVVEILRKRGKTYIRKIPVSIGLAGVILALYGLSGKPTYNIGTPFQAAAKCITDLQWKGVQLEGGVANYWYARSVDYLSSSGAKTFTALNTLEPFFWMTSLDSFNSQTRFNYILVHNNPEPFNFNYENMKGWLPDPSQKFECTEAGLTVFFYESNSLDKLVKESRSTFMKSLR